MSLDSDQRKILSAVCHGSIFLSSLLVSIAIPIIILAVVDDPFVKENAKEALNFHLNLWLYGIIAGILIFVGIGFILLGLLGIISFVMPIIAIVKILGENETFRYPFIFRLV